MKKRIIFILAGFLSGASIGLFVFYNLLGQFPNLQSMLIILFSAGIIGVVLLLLFYGISQIINPYIPWEKRFGVRIAIDFLANASTGIIVSGGFYVGALQLIPQTNKENFWITYKESFFILWILVVVLVLIYNISMLMLYAQSHYAEGQIANVKQERKQLKLQFEALKNQLSPHFLFNSLNTISSLIYKDANRAEEFIRRLADTYQYVLGTHQEKLIPLSKELEFVEAYYFLLKVRFPKGLSLLINIPPQFNTSQIPPLTIQILIENAIKHNVFSEEQPLNIEVAMATATEISVINNKTVAPQIVKSNHIGLKNIEKRFSYFTNSKVKISNNETFEVRFPVISSTNLSQVA